jgi:transcriptional regulator with XRE-family HTH domain
MRVGEKLRQYLKDNGIEKSWFASKLGISRPFFSQLLRSERKFPPKFWAKVVHLSRCNIDLYDLMLEHFEETPSLMVSMKRSNFGCFVSLSEVDNDNTSL